MELRFLTSLFAFFYSFILNAQISGVVNNYTPVLGFNCDSTNLQVESTNGFFNGQLVLIIQMQGAVLSQENDATFGDIISNGSVGNYEFNRIEQVANGEIKLRFHLTRPFDLNGKVQIVGVPEYVNVVAQNVTCKPWDGTTGGVLALDVSGTLTLQGNIDASSTGFKGGLPVYADFSIYHETQYVYPFNPRLAAVKGEGIGLLPPDKMYGRGRAANGGGGGNAHNAGGGGGGNGGNGGNGGLEYYNIPDQPTQNTNGLGGVKIFELDAQKAIMGGGGGAGHANDFVSEPGGNGGGIMFIRSNVIVGNNFSLLSNGGDVNSPGTNRNDGQGGGGAGGTIFLKVDQLAGSLTAEAKGGRGGDCFFFVGSQVIGPGGGGSGGKLALKTPLPGLTININGGINGVGNENLSNDALPGQPGSIISQAIFWPDDSIPTLTEVAITFCFGESVTINGEVYTESGTVIDTLSTSGGCDSIVTYTLTELPQYTNTSDISSCSGDPVTVHGQVYFAPATIIDTLTALNGCDSIVTTNLLLQPYNTGTQNISFCPGDGVEIGGQFYTESATVIDTIPVTGACDSIITYHLTLLPQNTRSETIQFCAGDSVTLGGQTYFASGTVELTLPGITGCDTIVTYTILVLPKPVRSEDISICAGQSVTIGGVTYTESTEVTLTLPSSTACDTVVTYHLTVIPAVTGTENVAFCPGTSVLINGESYSAAGTVVDTLTAASGCDSIMTYQLSLLPQPTRSETIKLCPGESVVLGGQTYSQPGTVTLQLPATTGCDTLVTYIIASELPAPSVVNIQCPANVSLIADPGTAPLAVNYNAPTADTDCPCPGLTVALTAGVPSGGLFPNGITQVCYKATDACGHSATCCFTVTVREIQPCDVKETPCVRYELLTITADAGQNLTYRIRVINNCANKLIYTAIQLPDGVVAMEPDQLSVFTAESGRKYDVRNPNFSPFYSIRFKSIADSISNGQSDIFQYTLPAQSAPLYMDITSRLATQVFYEAHLNTFYCPIGVTQSSANRDNAATAAPADQLRLFPNPSDGMLWVDLSHWSGQHPTWRIFNSQGQQVLQNTAVSQDDLLRIDLPQSLPQGLYFFEIQAEDGKRETMRFLLKS